MTELTFLLDLLLNHRIPAATKVAITERIKEVEKRLLEAPVAYVSQPRNPPSQTVSHLPPHLANQSPSTIAALQRHPDLVAEMAKGQPPVQPVAVVAQTPAAQAALAQRQEAINLAISGKPEKGRTSPRKF